MVSFSSFMRGMSKWDSEAQEKGMKALQKALTEQAKGRLTDQNSIWMSFAFLIQKDHESQEWLVKLFGDQISRLEDQIKKLQNQIKTKATPHERP